MQTVGASAATVKMARLYFHPATGAQLRITNAATRSERRTAPRVAMFEMTNACNLRCDFCSRDT